MITGLYGALIALVFLALSARVVCIDINQLGLGDPRRQKPDGTHARAAGQMRGICTLWSVVDAAGRRNPTPNLLHGMLLLLGRAASWLAPASPAKDEFACWGHAADADVVSLYRFSA
jgi:hypothetical protein